MARDLRDIAKRKDAPKPAAAPVCAAAPNATLAKTPRDADDREAFHRLIRTLARELARADHARDA
jgi:hypothetical protein